MPYFELPTLDVANNFTNEYWNQVKENQRVLEQRSSGGVTLATAGANAVIVGSATGDYTALVLSEGDLLVGGATGITKLAIGTEGQILAVGSNGMPAWINDTTLSVLSALRGF